MVVLEVHAAGPKAICPDASACTTTIEHTLLHLHSQLRYYEYPYVSSPTVDAARDLGTSMYPALNPGAQKCSSSHWFLIRTQSRTATYSLNPQEYTALLIPRDCCKSSIC